MSEADYHALYLSGIECFNDQAFFECHEVWETLWRQTEGSRKKFLKGLIQAAVSMHHLRRGNIAGARKLFDGAQRYLAPFLPRYLGLDVEQLLERIATCFMGFPEDVGHLAPSQVPIRHWPRIHLSPPGG